MKIAVLGVGALGSVYALHLSRVVHVTLVVRSIDRAPESLSGEKINGPVIDDTWKSPPAVTEIPDDADVVLVAVRSDQVLGLREMLARGPDRLIVILSPLLPLTLQAMREALGDRLVVAMTGVIGYQPTIDPRVRRVRYWTPGSAPTTLEDRAEGDPRRERILELREAMRASLLPCELSRKVAGVTAAAMVAFFPILAGIVAAGGSIDRMLEDRALLSLALDAAKEGKALAKDLGDLPSWASLFFGFMSGWTVRAGIKLGRAKAPESITVLERHFGGDLAIQNHAMFREISALAEARGIPITALRRLVALSP